MPGWYAQLKPHIDAGQIVLIGSIQEQHAERCRLFQQWKELEFPVVQDMLNSNGIAVVPVYVAIDEHGIVRGVPRQAESFLNEFLTTDYPAPEQIAPPIDLETIRPSHWEQIATATGEDSVRTTARIRWADCLIQWGGSKAEIERAIEIYREVQQSLPQSGDISFRLGCAYRLLYEQTGQRDGMLFRDSVAAWEAARQKNPNQYIYRRRIEQYGPRLKKPYSFYDWVSSARIEIRQRGEQPIELLVEPNGAELAERSNEMLIDVSSQEPDPDQQILPAAKDLISVHTSFVPSHPEPGEVVAVHVVLNVTGAGKWNHESTPLEMWINSPSSEVALSTQLMRDQKDYDAAETKDPVSLSFEVELPKDLDKSPRLTGYLLFNVCESEGGQCLYRRQDFAFTIPIRE